MTDKTDGLALLRKPFPEHQISYLPKGGAKLAYVGHAALTDRLLDADQAWQWEPLAMSPDGLPVMDGLGGMWIRLTVCGVTRLGYGHAGSKVGGDAIKEVIGDALRNAAMRFGAALELWHKGELHVDEPRAMSEKQIADWCAHIEDAATGVELKARLQEAMDAGEGDQKAQAHFHAAAQARIAAAKANQQAKEHT
jgi:hypothetical protein